MSASRADNGSGMPKALTHCPSCGQPVTPYAAGCAVCGEDIEAARNALAQRRIQALNGPNVPRVRLGDDVLRIVIALLGRRRGARLRRPARLLVRLPGP